MWNAICRPELHGAPTREQYDDFHAGMKQLGLERTITKDGKVFNLPTGEYLGVDLFTSLQVLTLQITSLAIRVTGHQAKLILVPVSDLAGIHIYGLEKEETFASELGFFSSISLTSPAQNSGLSALWTLTNAPQTSLKP
jgi:hypothetical protein